MKVHHLNCGTLCPIAAHWVAGDERKLVCHCLLLETSAGLALVDSGFGTADLRDPGGRLGPGIRAGGPRFDPEETALAQVRRLGFAPGDVRHVVLTHLDLDHAGGISDFPEASIHVFGAEHAAATAAARSFLGSHRYRDVHWAHGPKWETYSQQGEAWNGFETVRALRGLPPEILLIPLSGHSAGHCGVAVDTGQGWLLHAGDAYFFHGEMQAQPWCTPGLSVFQRAIAFDRPAWRRNQARLRELALGKKASVFCAHDAREFGRLQATGTGAAGPELSGRRI